MHPIRHIDALVARYGAMGFPPYDWSRYDDALFTPLAVLALAVEAREPGCIVDDELQWPVPFAFNPAPPTPEAIAGNCATRISMQP